MDCLNEHEYRNQMMACILTGNQYIQSSVHTVTEVVSDFSRDPNNSDRIEQLRLFQVYNHVIHIHIIIIDSILQSIILVSLCIFIIYLFRHFEIIQLYYNNSWHEMYSLKLNVRRCQQVSLLRRPL